MQPTPIKINKPSANGNDEPARPAKNILNLNSSPARPSSNNRLKKYLWLLLVLVIAEGAAIAWLYFLKPVSPYQKLLPPDAIASSYFNQVSLVNLIKSQKATNPAWPLLAWGDEALKSFLSQAKIEKPEQILALFSDPTALVILPQETKTKPTWLVLASIKASVDVFSRSRDQAEQSLKQNFNLASELYRQIKVSQIQPLSQDKNSLFYARVNDYFVLTNNKSLIKETIDKIVGR